MKNSVIPFLFPLFLLFSCTSGTNFSIVGSLPNKTYDGEIIYLVPIDKPVKGYIDSMIVRDGAIQFRGHATNPEICVIRAKPVLRYNLEELLVVREPGGLTVTIDKNSSVHGTPLNDSLQYWKERKMRFDFVKAELAKQYREANENVRQNLKQKADMLSADATDFHFKFAMNNRENIVGQFVWKVMVGSFSEEQKQKLDHK